MDGLGAHAELQEERDCIVQPGKYASTAPIEEEGADTHNITYITYLDSQLSITEMVHCLETSTYALRPTLMPVRP
jgi:hypothetical protein